MGNLYTHIVKQRHDPRIEILSFLKQAWRSKPIDYEYIGRLRKELKRLESKKKVNPYKMNYKKHLQKKYGLFAYKIGG